MRTIERETGDGRPPLPLPWIGSPRLVARAVTHPRTVNPVIAASALLPAGRGQAGIADPAGDGAADAAGRHRRRLGARRAAVGGGRRLRLRPPDRVRPPRRAAVDGRGGRAGLVLHPGLVHAAGDRRAPLRRRRGRVVHVAGPARAAGCAAAGRGVRARAAGQPRVRPAAATRSRASSGVCGACSRAGWTPRCGPCGRRACGSPC